MRTTWLLLLGVMAAGCGGVAEQDVEGPFTGQTHRFYVTHLALPQQKTDFAVDLNGDGRFDDQLGNFIGGLSGEGYAQQHVDEVIAAAPPIVVELTSDDPALRDDATVGVRFVGVAGASADVLGATLHGGLLRSNRVVDGHTGGTTVLLPTFAHADAAPITLDHFQVNLTANGDGTFNGQLNGAVPADRIVPELWPSFEQLLAAAPSRYLYGALDTNHDGTITYDEASNAGLVKNILAPDIDLGHPDNANKDHFSLGFAFTLAPCADEACTRAAAAASCFDRVKNGDEADVDCGGTCGPCGAGAACGQGADCQTQACDSGACRAPSCFDGLRDGIEVDIDCGPGCAPCQNGAHCVDNTDCASGRCATQLTTNEQICAPNDGT
jgi:hypothetical protein